MFNDLYDRPGSWLVDHPNSRKAVKRIVAATAVAVALALPAAASGSTAPVTPNPGSGIGGEY